MVKTKGFVSLDCLVWRIGEAWLIEASSAREVARDNIFTTEKYKKMVFFDLPTLQLKYKQTSVTYISLPSIGNPDPRQTLARRHHINHSSQSQRVLTVIAITVQSASNIDKVFSVADGSTLSIAGHIPLFSLQPPIVERVEKLIAQHPSKRCKIPAIPSNVKDKDIKVFLVEGLMQYPIFGLVLGFVVRCESMRFDDWL